MSEENETETFLEAVEKIRRLFEKYPCMGFYINQISETVQMDRCKVERILDKSTWVNKKGKRYYYLPLEEDILTEFSFEVNQNEEPIVREEIKEDIEPSSEKIKLLRNPENLIQILKKERGIL